MRKYMFLLVALVLAVSTQAAWATPRLQASSAVESDTSLVLAAGTWVYGVSIYADSASSNGSVYDSATYQAGSSSNVKCEIGEATQYDTCTIWFPTPMKFSNGVSVQIDTGVITVYHGPEPQ